MNLPTKIQPPPTDALGSPEKLWNVVAVAGFLQAAGIPSSEPTLRRKVAAGTFPQPLRFGGRCIRWRPSDVQAWLKAHTAGPIVGAAEGGAL